MKEIKDMYNKAILDSENLSQILCDECLGKNTIISTPYTPSSIWYQNILLVEDGSVDTAKLDELGIKYIVYRQGSQKPEILKLWDNLNL